MNDEKFKFLITDDVSESAILSAIMDKTGLTADQIQANWELEMEDESDENETSEQRGTRIVERLTQREVTSQENAQETILQLQQKIDQLEQRLQGLLEKFESGEYFGNIPEPDPTPVSYGVTFVGTATSLIDGSVHDIDGEVFLETLISQTHGSKFRVTGGEIIVGDMFYDFVIGKARGTGDDTLLLLGQVMDDQGNIDTIKLLLNPTSPITENSDGPINLDISMSQSKIGRDLGLDASGQISPLT